MEEEVKNTESVNSSVNEEKNEEPVGKQEDIKEEAQSHKKVKEKR